MRRVRDFPMSPELCVKFKTMNEPDYFEMRGQIDIPDLT